MRPHCHALLLALVASSTIVLPGGPEFTDWGTPLRLTAIEAPGYRTASPFLTKDGSWLYFGSDRPGGTGSFDIWAASWNDLTGDWNTPVNLGPILNSAGSDWYPALSRDEHWMYFMSNRAGGYGGYDLWASHREDVHDEAGWQPPINLGAAVNTAGQEASPSYFANDELGLPQLFFTSTGTPDLENDVYVAEMLGPTELLPAMPVTELNTVRSLPESKGLEISVSIRHDGLEIFLTSNRPGSMATGQDLWVATRATPLAAWSRPVNVGPVVNTAAAERDAMIASDRRHLFFSSAFEILYVSTREKARQP
jgi:hypothetical protein